MRSVIFALVVMLVCGATGCGEKPEPQGAGTESHEMSEPSPIEYSVHAEGWRAVAIIEKKKADVEWIEEIAGEESEPVTKTVVLKPDDFQMVQRLVQQAARTPARKTEGAPPVVAEATLGENRASWTGEELQRTGPGREIRRWAETRLNLAFMASSLAAGRAGVADTAGDEATAARLWKEAVDRLADWWKPDEPILDETGNRYVIANGALERQRYREAIQGFRRVHEMRMANYSKTHDLEDH